MSNTETTLPAPPPPPSARERGSIMIPYKDLLEIKLEMARMGAALSAALALQGTVSDHDRRIASLELHRAASSGSSDVWKRVVDLFWGLVLAFIAAGVWFK